MKAFVIKNKEGKYWYGYDLLVNKNLFTTKISNAVLNNPTKKNCLDAIKEYDLKNCKIVEITIAEGDLEQENQQLKEDIKLDNAFWKQECDSLQSSLAEKDDEIEHLKDCNESLSNKFDKESDMQNEIYILKYNVEDLEQQLAVKDKEIDALNKTIFRISKEKEIASNIQNIDYLSFAIQIRKQVCDELRDYFGKFTPIFIQVKTDVLDKLDQIEKGDVVDDNKAN